MLFGVIMICVSTALFLATDHLAYAMLREQFKLPWAWDPHKGWALRQETVRWANVAIHVAWRVTVLACTMVAHDVEQYNKTLAMSRNDDGFLLPAPESALVFVFWAAIVIVVLGMCSVPVVFQVYPLVQPTQPNPFARAGAFRVYKLVCLAHLVAVVCAGLLTGPTVSIARVLCAFVVAWIMHRFYSHHFHMLRLLKFAWAAHSQISQ